jgi:hypothetical protein
MEQAQLKEWIGDIQQNAAMFERVHARLVSMEHQLDKPKWHAVLLCLAIPTCAFLGFLAFYILKVKITDKDEKIFQKIDMLARTRIQADAIPKLIPQSLEILYFLN